MRKILLTFDGTHYSHGAFELAKRLNENETVLLIGAFLPEIEFTSLAHAFGSGSIYIPLTEGVDEGKVDENILQFKQDCEQHHIEYRVHKDLSPYALPRLQKESRYADLMILGSQKFYGNGGQDAPNEFLRDTLHDTECPVIIAPENFIYPESVVLAYDGTRSSALAIKMFAYLFPDLCQRNTILAYAHTSPDAAFPDMDYIRELAARHYPDLTFQQLDASKKDYFSAWMSTLNNPILVTGAFGRSGLSSMFKKSFASNVITEQKYPVFIAHH